MQLVLSGENVERQIALRMLCAHEFTVKALFIAQILLAASHFIARIRKRKLDPRKKGHVARLIR
jgi:hypothetical protein